jgi:hypothetical protein
MVSIKIPTAATAVSPPIGSVIAWLKSYTNTPALPSGWVECSGQTLSDADSVYNGQVIPNLNTGTQRFLRGSSTSGTTGGVDTNGGYVTGAVNDSSRVSSGSTCISAAAVSNCLVNFSILPSYYEVVWIMRIK